MSKPSWEERFKTFWKPLLKTNGKWDEKKISDELHDLVFIYEQVGEVYCHLTGNLLSKPMYYAGTIITAHDDLVTELVEDEIEELLARHSQEKVEKVWEEMLAWAEDGGLSTFPAIYFISGLKAIKADLEAQEEETK